MLILNKHRSIETVNADVFQEGIVEAGKYRKKKREGEKGRKL